MTVPCHTLRTYETVPPGHDRRTLYNLPDVSEHKQCCGRHRLPYPAMPCALVGRCHRGMPGEHGRVCQTLLGINSIMDVDKRLAPDSMSNKTMKHTYALSLSFFLTCKAIPSIKGDALFPNEGSLSSSRQPEHSNSSTALELNSYTEHTLQHLVHVRAPVTLSHLV